MSVKTIFTFALLCWLQVGASGSALAQGFAGMGSNADGYLLPDSKTRFDFPADHGPHPGFRIEWWYLTGNLQDAEGNDYGIQWTLFRSALAPELGKVLANDDSDAENLESAQVPGSWQTPVLWMGHAALTTDSAHYVAERFARGGIGQAGVTSAPYVAWIDDWAMTGFDTGRLTARGDLFSYDLAFQAKGPIVLQGKNGYSVKSQDGQASHYYSQPFYQLSGTLNLPDGPVDVTGQGWLDREWSSQPLASDQSGWDWLSLHFDDGSKLMGFALRSARSNYVVGTWITASGLATPLENDQIRLELLSTTRVAGRKIPTRWKVQVPDKDLEITVTALNPQSWMSTAISYWEGPVRISGSHSGRGYLEMTGYE